MQCKIKIKNLQIILLIIYEFSILCKAINNDDLPTLYEYYTQNKITKGLSDNQPYFTLNNKNITIYSGSLHYFRMHPEYWRQSLRKLRAIGLNAVQTYFPWNLHEYQIDKFDFGNGSSDLRAFLDVAKFLKIAQEEDLFVIARPGPYIDSEFEFGGLPSWLLRFKDIKVRTSDPIYIERVSKYLGELFKILAPLQFTKGGPIISFQIENEYGNTKEKNTPIDSEYLSTLKRIFQRNNVVELMFTSDTPSAGFWGTIPNVLATANFDTNPDLELGLLRKFQPNKPLMVTEFWSGWYDVWTKPHQKRRVDVFRTVLERILQLNASVNMYMFHGGTTWGFLNGADFNNSKYEPDTSSYDYDASLSETGYYTKKYVECSKIIKRYNTILTKKPSLPKLQKIAAFKPVKVTGQIGLGKLLGTIKPVISEGLVPMEILPINNGTGQQFGYIVYRKTINCRHNSSIMIFGQIRDTIMVLINGVVHYYERTFSPNVTRLTINLNTTKLKNVTLDLLVENCGRVNYGKLKVFRQFKGISNGVVFLDNKLLEKWQIFPLEFKTTWNLDKKDWQTPDFSFGPTLYRAVLNVEEKHDTFVDMRKWQKGVLIVNGFVLSRYWNRGPQQTAYLPATFLKVGKNEVLIFEEFTASKFLEFNDHHVYFTRQ